MVMGEMRPETEKLKRKEITVTDKKAQLTQRQRATAVHV